MVRISVFLSLLLIGALAVCITGCERASDRPAASSIATKSDSIAENLDKLPPEDRSVAEAQGYCAAEPENRLGTMGVPIKVMVKDQPVFVCCAGCEKRVLRDADATLAQVVDLKARVAAEKAAKP